jgi:protein-S-isoprenylcysteine O-methyltransferase Ste14
MLPEFVPAGLLAILAMLFFVVRSAWDSRKLPRGRGRETELSGSLFALGMTGLAVFAFVTVAYPVLYLLGWLDRLTDSFLQLRFPGDIVVQLVGIALLAVGNVLVFWTLHAIEPGSLTTTGPYARIRHPMYTGYFLVFLGLVLLILNLVALPCLLFIPAQAAVARLEEAELGIRYGETYRAYAARSGRFWPRMIHI